MMVFFHSFILYVFFISEIWFSGAFNPYYLRKEKASGSAIPIQENEFPFIVGLYTHQLKKHLQPKCLGTILNAITILTAASCIFDRWGNVRLSPRTYVVLYGIREGCDMYQEYEPQLIRQAIMHENFDVATRKADLAFMIAYKPLLIYNFTQIIPPANGLLNKNGEASDKYFITYEELPVGTKCIFIGFFAKNNTGSSAQRLTYSSIEIENQLLCIEAYAHNKTHLYPDKYCAGIPSKGEVPTWQDAGGPLICGSKLVGITSLTSEFGTNPGVFTSLRAYQNFIKYATDYAYLTNFLKAPSYAPKLVTFHSGLSFILASLLFRRVSKFILRQITEIVST